MNINIICIGKLKEKYWQDAAAEYVKRLGGYCNIKIIELREAKLPANAGAKDEEIVMAKEGADILGKIGRSDYVVAMAVEGKMLGSVELADTVSGIFSGSRQTIDFVIGGSLGLSPEVKRRADMLLSFSKMTFPHQLARVMLLEQIYRAYKIMNGETYHK